MKPTGQDNPEANSRCTCDSVVRAPIAPQLIKSATYCGVIMSRNSLAVGIPMSVRSSSNLRPMRRPSLIS
ncbi:Uncharacterised protein [Vibrio cholerae]|nr:Uncharacterised protein [Vibrio cholerae]